MRVGDVMTEDVKAVPPSTTVSQASDVMKGSRINHLAVIEGTELVGVVSARDLDSAARKARSSEVVRNVMTRQVISVTPSTPVRRAANLMRGHSIGSLLVKQGRRVVGIVTVSDLLDLIGSGAQKPVSRGKRWTLSHRVPHVKKPRPNGMW